MRVWNKRLVAKSQIASGGKGAEKVPTVRLSCLNKAAMGWRGSNGVETERRVGRVWKPTATGGERRAESCV